MMGPDHYVPFIAMARVGRWSFSKMLAITVLCGLGHVLGSVALGLVGLTLGLMVGGLEAIEAARGDVAAWLLLGFGLAYTAWGIRHALRKRPHSHWHGHADGTVHRHSHVHVDDHSHVHAPKKDRSSLTPWALFTVFVFGPCEVLIPQLMYPVAHHNWWGLFVVLAVFTIATVGTMVAAVTVGYKALDKVAVPHLERYSHAVAGLALSACGVAIKFGL